MVIGAWKPAATLSLHNARTISSIKYLTCSKTATLNAVFKINILFMQKIECKDTMLLSQNVLTGRCSFQTWYIQLLKMNNIHYTVITRPWRWLDISLICSIVRYRFWKLSPLLQWEISYGHPLSKIELDVTEIGQVTKSVTSWCTTPSGNLRNLMEFSVESSKKWIS